MEAFIEIFHYKIAAAFTDHTCVSPTLVFFCNFLVTYDLYMILSAILDIFFLIKKTEEAKIQYGRQFFYIYNKPGIYN